MIIWSGTFPQAYARTVYDMQITLFMDFKLERPLERRRWSLEGPNQMKSLLILKLSHTLSHTYSPTPSLQHSLILLHFLSHFHSGALSMNF